MDARETCEAIVQAVRQQTVGLELVPPHDYYLGDRRIPGVNELIDYVQKNGDGPWLRDDDSLRGDAVHAAIAADVPAEYMADEEIAGYRRGWEAWCAESGFVPVARELPVLCFGTTTQDPGTVPLYAGTLDSFGHLADVLVVVDVKSHRTKLPETKAPRWPWQVTAYMQAVLTSAMTQRVPLPHGPGPLCHRMIVSLAPGGGYRAWHVDNFPILAWAGLVAGVRYHRGRRYWSKP